MNTQRAEDNITNNTKKMEGAQRSVFLKKIETFFSVKIYGPWERLKWSILFYSKQNRTLCTDEQNVFAEIYRTKFWGSKGSVSGAGSYIETTEIIREKLPILWKKYGIKTFLDVPCGDFYWMQLVDKTAITYIGGDIVPELVEANNKEYKSENISFRVLDITTDRLPQVDMIFCKDCLQHLSYENIFKALENFKKSNSKYLLVSSYPYTLFNQNIPNGSYWPLNLRKKPFKLPAPIEKIKAKYMGSMIEKDKYMYLYELSKI